MDIEWHVSLKSNKSFIKTMIVLWQFDTAHVAEFFYRNGKTIDDTQISASSFELYQYYWLTEWQRDTIYGGVGEWQMCWKNDTDFEHNFVMLWCKEYSWFKVLLSKSFFKTLYCFSLVTFSSGWEYLCFVAFHRNGGINTGGGNGMSGKSAKFQTTLNRILGVQCSPSPALIGIAAS